MSYYILVTFSVICTHKYHMYYNYHLFCSRLCSDVAVADQVVELQGVCRLVRLCKEERERNHSDGVLVACLVCFLIFLQTCVPFLLANFIIGILK